MDALIFSRQNQICQGIFNLWENSGSDQIIQHSDHPQAINI